MWRDNPALRGGGFELLLNYHWIKKGRGAVVWPLGCWGVVNWRLEFVPCNLLPVAVGSVSSVLAFQ